MISEKVYALTVAFALCMVSMAQGDDAPVEFIRDWEICGPFEAVGLDQFVVTNEASIVPAEGAELAGKKWISVSMEKDVVNLQDEDLMGYVDDAIAYAYAEVVSAQAGTARLSIKSDDSVAVWWNGRLIMHHPVLRGLDGAPDHIYVNMREGKNTILLKVYDAGGGWGYSVGIQPVGDEPWAWRSVRQLDDDELLDLIEKKHFLFFWETADPDTGLIPDGAPALASSSNDAPCSVASVGFGLSAICIGDSRGWVTREEAEARVIKTLTTMRDVLHHEHGFFYHFVDMKTGKRAWNCEISSIDTALFIAGALTVRNYFDNPEITKLANDLYERVDWPWMLNGEDTLTMGWHPESDFIVYRWDGYSEQMVMLLMAMGSPTHPLSPEAWHVIKRYYFTYNDMTYMQAVPLFLHQYSHCWVDFRGIRDAYADYFLNSKLATLAHRDFMVSFKDKFPYYSENLWGVTASKGPERYMVWGGPPPTFEYPIDGTVVPCSAGGSLMFAPEETLPVMRELYENHGSAWGRFGFYDAYNPHTGWVADGYLGIDVGATILSAENLRTGNVWKWFMESPEIQKAIRDAGFVNNSRELSEEDLEYLRTLARATWDCISHFVHPDTQMPYDKSAKPEHTSVSNIGLYLVSLAVAREFGFISAEEALARAQKLVASIEAFPSWKGFAQCWHTVDELIPSEGDPWVSVVDSGNLALCLAAAAQAFPELQKRCDKLLKAMDWQAFYDEQSKQLFGGYDMLNKQINPDWRVDTLATDSRAATIMAVAYGDVPPAAWSNLTRKLTDQYYTKYLEPGWIGGGLFMQYITGIFIDEKDSLMGRSAANFTYAQLRHKDVLGLPAWGWSSCEDPHGGYIGWGKLRDEVVTPHASVLAIEDYPQAVVQNLRALEQMGVREPWLEDGESRDFGFRDAVDMSAGKVSDQYLVLDQTLLFLSLANFLQDELVRRWFYADTKVDKAINSIGTFAEPEGGPMVSIFEPGLKMDMPRAQVQRHLEIPKAPQAMTIDGDLSDWAPMGQGELKYPDHAELGVPPMKERYYSVFSFAWDENFLYFSISVHEDEVITKAQAAELYKDDAVELFIDPHNDGFMWGSESDFQIGMSPSGPDKHPQHYSWFQKTPLPYDAQVAARVVKKKEGDDWILEARIPWSFLGLERVEVGQVVGVSPALHTVNKKRTASAKINWSYVVGLDRVSLGQLKLIE